MQTLSEVTNEDRNEAAQEETAAFGLAMKVKSDKRKALRAKSASQRALHLPAAKKAEEEADEEAAHEEKVAAALKLVREHDVSLHDEEHAKAEAEAHVDDQEIEHHASPVRHKLEVLDDEKVRQQQQLKERLAAKRAKAAQRPKGAAVSRKFA